VQLAGRRFGSIKLDISPRAYELDATDIVAVPNALEFAGFATVEIEIVDVHRHAAEKLHAMLREFGDRENTRVRDLGDLMLLLHDELLSAARLASAVTDVWAERDATMPPTELPPFPPSWPQRYERLAAENEIDPPSFGDAAERAAALWREMFRRESA
jgi:hypothetical protein